MYLIKRTNGIYYIEYWCNYTQSKKRFSTKTKIKSKALQQLNSFSPQQDLELDEISLKAFKLQYKSFISKTYSKSYLRSVNLSFDMLEEHFGHIKLNLITSHKLEKFFDLTYNRTQHGAYLYLRTLKAAFNKAKRWNHISLNPFIVIKLPKIAKQRPTFISEEQLSQIINVTDEKYYKNAFLFAFYTGMRLGEIVNLRWTEVSFPENLITVKSSHDFRTKNNKTREIPISKKLHDVLITLNKKTEYVFVNNKNRKLMDDALSKTFKRKVIECNMDKKIHFHSLRHSFASLLVQRGASIYAVKELLGHSDINTTQIYAHLNKETLIKTIKMLNL